MLVCYSKALISLPQSSCAVTHTGQICHCKEVVGVGGGQKSQYFRPFKSHRYNTINVLSFKLPEKKVEENKHSFASVFYVCVRMKTAKLAIF